MDGEVTRIDPRALAERLEDARVPYEFLDEIIRSWANAREQCADGPVPATVLEALDRDIAEELDLAPVLGEPVAGLRRGVVTAVDLERALDVLVETRARWEEVRWRQAQQPAWREFPIGCTLGDGAYQLVEPVRGQPARGLYRATGPDGARCLVTLGSPQREPIASRRLLLGYQVDGVAPLLHIGPLDGRGEDFCGMVEAEPAGRPAAALRVPLAPAAAVRLALDLVAILERVHQAAGPLRYLRPELIYVDDGVGGRVTALAPRAEAFLEGATPCYGVGPLFDAVFAAPEVLALARSITPAADLFSLCAILGLWLSGEHLFEGDTPMAQMAAICTGRGRVWSGPTALGMVLAGGLDPDPAARPTLKQLAADLARAAGEDSR